MPVKYKKQGRGKKFAESWDEFCKDFDTNPKDVTRNYQDWTGLTLYDWAKKYRMLVEGKDRVFILPLWKHIMLDSFPWQMFVGGRQIYKSTFFGDCLAYYATTVKGSTGLYVTYNDESLSAFSTDKYRMGVLDCNSEIKNFVVGGSTLGQVHRVGYKNFAKTYMVTDEGKFHHVEGKSPDLMIIDEGQYIDFQHWVKMREAMATTQGDIKIGGIGGEEGSPYYQLWKSTNQCHWRWKYPNYRDKIEFDKNGPIWGEYLLDYFEGEWFPTHPENKRHGYWLPQTLFPHIPRTIQEAIEKYKQPTGEFSIEYKEANYPETDFLNHVMGEFYVGTKRPLTEDMVRACMIPYHEIRSFTPQDIMELRATFPPEDIAVFFGVDFGSGNVGSSKTVACVLVKFRARPEFGVPIPRYFLAHITADFPNDDDDKAELLASMISRWQVDAGVGDLGYGEHIIKKVQQGGYNRTTGIPWEGVTRRKLRGCWTRQDPVQVTKYDRENRDETGRKVGHYTIDKTHSIQSFIDFIKRYATHPLYRSEYWKPGELHVNNQEFKFARSQLIIPYETQRKMEWIIKEFTSIVRKDINEEEIREEDKRQRARREFMHPPDAVMAVIYALTAEEHYDPKPYEIQAVKKRI
jgi:hypothetical protein